MVEYLVSRKQLLVPNYRLRRHANGWYYVDWTRNGKPKSKSCKTKNEAAATVILDLYREKGEALAAPFMVDDTPPAAPRKRVKRPCVYLIGNAANSLIKIGRSGSCVHARLAMLEIGSPVDLTLLHIEECQSNEWAVALETGLHWIFAEQRVRGEWFAVTVDEVRARVNDAVVVIGKLVAPRWPGKITNSTNQSRAEHQNGIEQRQTTNPPVP
jgi:hypothetical protein